MGKALACSRDVAKRMSILNRKHDEDQEFKQKHPSSHRNHPGIQIATVRMALVPYLGGITYMGVVNPQPHFDRFKYPKDIDEAIETAVASAKAVFGKENHNADVQVYETLDPKADVGLSRLASDDNNEGEHRAMICNDISQPRPVREGCTGVLTTQLYWTPTKSLSDPTYRPLLSLAMGAERPFQLEGFKNNTGALMQVEDSGPCPFHIQHGKHDTKPFAECCKETYLYRKERADRKGNSMHMQIVYEPFGRKDLESFGVMNGDDSDDTVISLPPGLEKFMRMNFFENVGVEIKVPLECVPIIKGRIDECPVFQAVLPHKWIFFGALPTSHPQMGVMTFGDLELNPETGAFVADCLSAGRLTHMIIEMKDFCGDLPVQSAKIVARPAYKVKANMHALEQNFELLQDGWEGVATDMIVNKDANASMGRSCSYCGEDDNAKLDFKCTCKSAYYCSEECRRKHWKLHKDKCLALRSTGN